MAVVRSNQNRVVFACLGKTLRRARICSQCNLSMEFMPPWHFATKGWSGNLSIKRRPGVMGWRHKMRARAQTGTEPHITIMADAERLLNGTTNAHGKQPINLALASDAHGAFVWGVLDRFLDEPDFPFLNIAAAGFGAAEAAVLAYGLALGGRRGARTALTNFWRRVSHASMFAADIANPLKSILEQSIDIDDIRKSPVELSVFASNARTDVVKVFAGDELSIDAVLAAATIPFLFPAIEIDGEVYWGHSDLSALPPVRSGDAADVLIIVGRPVELWTADSRLSVSHRAATPIPIHSIVDNQHRACAALFTRPWTDWGRLTDARDRGRERAGKWLEASYAFVDPQPAVDTVNRYV
ncbi:hypothetical protein [Mesorhizobium sp. M00.F.Ca.ET.216.01.1.1]|uniref:patatin-like phospholipase family protein n=1 Tax=Mesorhizobium sp. M00.F.Ca.ET.216.01.1.1 TaxID=2500528 RepID=UPI001FE02CF2|nr:hypothetical protein [Mesorhizobium sp. M00.F.Ca.ET.216.01.1.1]